MADAAVCELAVTGMTCSACSRAIQGALQAMAGIYDVEIDVLTGSVRVFFSDPLISVTQICNAIESLGFTARLCQISLASTARCGHSTTHFSSKGKTKDVSVSINEKSKAREQAVLTGTEYQSSESGTSQSGTSSCNQLTPTEADPTIPTATIQFGFKHSNLGEVEKAKSLLQQLRGVVSVIESSTEGHEQKQSNSLCITYNPFRIGARQLLHQMHEEGLLPVIQHHDALETQKDHLIQTKRNFEKTLLVCMIPAICIVWLSVKGRSNTLPHQLMRHVIPGLQTWILLLIVFATPLQFYGGRFFHSAALKALRHRRCSMEVLVSISSTFAYTFSVISTIHSSIVATRCVTPSPEEGSIPYGLKGLNSDEPHAPASTLHLSTAVGTALAPSNFFDTCAFLIPILLLGKVLQLRARLRILQQLDSMRKLLVPQARLVLGGDMYAHMESQIRSQFNAKWDKDASTAHSNGFLHTVPDYGKLPRDDRWGRSGTPGSVHSSQEIPIDTVLLQIGDVVKVNSRENFPADGTLLEPSLVHVDEHVVSGERDSVPKTRGECLIGGTENVSSHSAFMKVEKVGSSSVLETLLRLIQAAQQGSRTRYHTAEKLIGILLPVALVTALATTTTWAFISFGAVDDSPVTPLQHIRQQLTSALHRGDYDKPFESTEPMGVLPTPEQGVNKMLSSEPFDHSPQMHYKPNQSSGDQTLVSEIIEQLRCIVADEIIAWDNVLFALQFGVAVCCVACPCAMGLAAPAAIAAATGTAARRGIYFKSKGALETAAKVKTLVIDKTGTITTGKLQVVACALHMERLRKMVLPAVKHHTASSCCSQTLSASGKEKQLSASEAGNDIEEVNKDVDRQLSISNERDGVSVGFSSLDQTCDNGMNEATYCVSTVKATLSAKQHQRMSCDLHPLPAGFTHVSTFSVISLQPDCWVKTISSSGKDEFEERCPIFDVAAPSNKENDAAIKSIDNKDNSYIQNYADNIESFLWILSCVEKHSTHAIANSIVNCYESWTQNQIGFSGHGIPLLTFSSCSLTSDTSSLSTDACGPAQNKSASLQHSVPEKALDVNKGGSLKLTRCSGVKPLPRGIAASLPLGNKYHLKVRISAYDGRNDESIDWKNAGINTDTMTVLQWTQWHEQNVGPVVHLFIDPFESSTTDSDLESEKVLEDQDLCQGLWLGAVALRDEVPKETQLVIRYLQQVMKMETHMCTGDNPRTASVVAKLVGIPPAHVHARQTAQGKLDVLTTLQKRGVQMKNSVLNSSFSLFTRSLCMFNQTGNICCMLGDGYNDAAALAGADIGVSFGTEASLLVASADATLQGHNWLEVANLFSIAKRTRRIILWNIAWAWLFNIITLPVAAGIFYPKVHLHPATAAALMTCSCMIVLLNALRLTRFTPINSAEIHRQLKLPPQIPTSETSKNESQGIKGRATSSGNTSVHKTRLYSTEARKTTTNLTKYQPVSDT